MKGFLAWVAAFWITTIILSAIIQPDGAFESKLGFFAWLAIGIIAWAVGNVAERFVLDRQRR